MSRTRIVDALEAAGIATDPTTPLTPAPGRTWVEWQRTNLRTRQGSCVVVDSVWWVLHQLPSPPDPAAVDALVATVADTLAAAGCVVDSAEPVSLLEAAPANPTPAVRWTVRTP
jgi:hypothetical protein